MRLTSKANAGALSKGDQIEIMSKPLDILTHPHRWTAPNGQQYVSLEVTGMHNPVQLDFPINWPVPRVIGARSGGQI